MRLALLLMISCVLLAFSVVLGSLEERSPNARWGPFRRRPKKHQGRDERLWPWQSDAKEKEDDRIWPWQSDTGKDTAGERVWPWQRDTKKDTADDRLWPWQRDAEKDTAGEKTEDDESRGSSLTS